MGVLVAWVQNHRRGSIVDGNTAPLYYFRLQLPLTPPSGSWESQVFFTTMFQYDSFDSCLYNF